MDNTEGSRAITQVFSVRKNVQLLASDRQMAVILGSLLGDAYVHPQGKICFEHSELQKDYLLWKYEELKTLAYPKIARVIRWDKRTQRQTVSWRFFLRQFFRPLRRAFYSSGKKGIPEDVFLWFSPLLLAVWYMDDGYLDRRKYPEFMTESFVLEDVQHLAKHIQQKFQLNCLVTSKKRIRILSNSKAQFFHLIEPWIHPNLRYKLP